MKTPDPNSEANEIRKGEKTRNMSQITRVLCAAALTTVLVMSTGVFKTIGAGEERRKMAENKSNGSKQENITKTAQASANKKSQNSKNQRE